MTDLMTAVITVTLLSVLATIVWALDRRDKRQEKKNDPLEDLRFLLDCYSVDEIKTAFKAIGFLLDCYSVDEIKTMFKAIDNTRTMNFGFKKGRIKDTGIIFGDLKGGDSRVKMAHIYVTDNEPLAYSDLHNGTRQVDIRGVSLVVPEAVFMARVRPEEGDE